MKETKLFWKVAQKGPVTPPILESLELFTMFRRQKVFSLTDVNEMTEDVKRKIWSSALLTLLLNGE